MSPCDGTADFRERIVCDPLSRDKEFGSVLHNIVTDELRESDSADKICLADFVGRNVLIRYG